MICTGFGCASPGVKHDWAAPQPLFPASCTLLPADFKHDWAAPQPLLVSCTVWMYPYCLTDFTHDWAAPQPFFRIFTMCLTDFSLRNFDMADNYLENQYEAYLARKAAKEKQKRLQFKRQLKAYKERLARENATAADDVVTEPQHRP